MGYLSQEQSIFRKLTVEKNLRAILEALPRSRSLGRRLTSAERWERTESALARFNLTHVRQNVAARCSGGEKRRLEIARCLEGRPLCRRPITFLKALDDGLSYVKSACSVVFGHFLGIL